MRGLVSGCFDLLHYGHMHLLHTAKMIVGDDKLLVALNSDESILKLKGRPPIIPMEQRRLMLLQLRSVDAVSVFNEDTPEEIINDKNPDIIFRGDDGTPISELPGYAAMASRGKAFCLIPRLDISTTAIIERIRSRQ